MDLTPEQQAQRHRFAALLKLMMRSSKVVPMNHNRTGDTFTAEADRNPHAITSQMKRDSMLRDGREASASTAPTTAA